MSNLFNFLLRNLDSDDVLWKFNATMFFQNIGIALGRVIGVGLYMFSYVLFMMLDFFSIIFKSLLGLGNPGTIVIEGSKQQFTNDFVLMILSSKTIQNIFLSLSIIALFLLIIAVIVAIIRSEYNWDKAGNSKGPIFSKAFKAIALYFTVPAACLFGIYASSLLLKAVDQATNSGENAYVSSLVFSASAFQGNRIRNDTTWQALGGEYKWYTNAGRTINEMPFCSKFLLYETSNLGSAWGNKSEDNQEMFASYVDNLFSSAGTIKAKTNLNADASTTSNKQYKKAGELDTSPYDAAGTGPSSTVIRDGFRYVKGTPPELFSRDQICSPYNIELIWFYYDLLPSGYSHILSLLVGFLLMKVLFDMACGVVKRAYELVVLFCISPPIVALMPLDDGAAYKTWVKSFLGKTLMAFGGVVAINFFFMLVPIFKTVNVFGPESIKDMGFFMGPWIIAFFNCLTQLLFILAGAMSLSSLSGMISSMIGAEDAADNGSKISGAVAGMGAKLGGMAFGAAKGLVKGAVGKFKKDGDGGDSGSGDSSPSGGGSGGGTPPSSGGSGGGGSPKKGASKGKSSKSSKISNFIKGTGTALGKVGDLALGKKGKDGKRKGGMLGLVKGVGKLAGSFYGSALGQIGDGRVGKSFESGVKSTEDAAEAIGGAVGAVGKGVVGEAKNIGEGMYKGAYAGFVNANSSGKGSIKQILAGAAGAIKGGVLYSTVGRTGYRITKNVQTTVAKHQSKKANKEFKEEVKRSGEKTYSSAQKKYDADIASGRYTPYGVTQIDKKKRELKDKFKKQMGAGKKAKDAEKSKDEAKANDWKYKF